MLASSMPDTMPSHIGKYPINRELGRGATSRVYLGHDPFGNREVAIKVVRPESSVDANVLKRFHKSFLNEAGLIGKLLHPHIVQIFEADVTEDYNYIVMEYAPGETLEERCSSANLLSMEQVVEIAFKCSLALDFANRHGVIHRDMKPANILRGAEGEIKISDFGAAQLESGDETIMQGIGSPAYMSPEQVAELPLTLQTDIYSLGVVMYQLFTGRLPFVASNKASLIYQIGNMEPPSPLVHRPELPESLGKFVLRALARDLSVRFSSWPEFSRELTLAYRHLELPPDTITDTQKYDAIKKIPFFQEFRDSETWEIVRMSSWRRHSPQKVIVKEGDAGESIFIIVEGEARVTKGGEDVDTLGKGDCFGELLYFEETRSQRSTTVTASSALTVVEIKTQALQQATDALQKLFNKAFLRILVDHQSQVGDRGHLRS
jgi:serine/threonine protein kinase